VEGLRKDGGAIPLELSVNEIILENGKLFTSILHDLTERKRTDKLKSAFVSTVSHELRTPLTSIYGSLKMVLAGVTGALPDKARKLLELAYNNSERLNLLINDILDIQKMEAGQMDFQFKLLDAAALIRRAVEENTGYAEKFGVRYSITEPVPDGLTVDGDESRLCQVLANFLSNAAKFSEPGDTIEVRVENTEPWVQFSVTDHGPGIPEAFQSRVFQKFAQADSSDTRQKGGTGLGLSISKVLVEKHHGEIGFNTTLGEGTTFFFRLPIIRDEA
jgi:signal transduction histidine kinase